MNKTKVFGAWAPRLSVPAGERIYNPGSAQGPSVLDSVTCEMNLLNLKKRFKVIAYSLLETVR